MQAWRKRVGRMGVQPPRFWQNRRRLRAAAHRRRAAFLLAHLDFQALHLPWDAPKISRTIVFLLEDGLLVNLILVKWWFSDMVFLGGISKALPVLTSLVVKKKNVHLTAVPVQCSFWDAHYSIFSLLANALDFSHQIIKCSSRYTKHS